MRKRTPPHSMTCRSPVTRFSMDLMQEIGSADVVLEGASFVLRDPDADKITGQVVALRQRMQGLARNVFQGDLTLEFDAVGAVLGHGFHPWKPGKFRSIPNLQSVHRLGCTPIGTHFFLANAWPKRPKTRPFPSFPAAWPSFPLPAPSAATEWPCGSGSRASTESTTAAASSS